MRNMLLLLCLLYCDHNYDLQVSGAIDDADGDLTAFGASTASEGADDSVRFSVSEFPQLHASRTSHSSFSRSSFSENEQPAYEPRVRASPPPAGLVSVANLMTALAVLSIGVSVFRAAATA